MKPELRQILFLILAFILIKVLTFGIGYAIATIDGFNRLSYALVFHHLEPDERYLGTGNTDFFQLWNYADSEWYLTIAQDGYPSMNEIISRQQQILDTSFRSTRRRALMSYAFFPLYPTIIAFFATVFPLRIAAFVSTLLLSSAAAVAFTFLVRKYWSEEGGTPIWPFLFLFLYPFSIFYSLYYAESLFLLLSILVFIFLRSRQYILMGLCGFLLSLSRPHGFLIVIPILYSLLFNREIHRTHVTKENIMKYLSVCVIPLGIVTYMAWCAYKTGDWFFYTAAVKSGWGRDVSEGFSEALSNFAYNLLVLGAHFFSLQLHHFTSSKIEYIVLLLFTAVIIWMWFDKRFPRELTLWSSLIWLVPLLGPKNNLMSFSRYMSASFPIFIFVSLHLGNVLKYIILILFSVGYLISLGNIIYYNWVG